MRYDPPRAQLVLDHNLCASFDGYNVSLSVMNERGSVLFVTTLDSAALTKFMAFARECGVGAPEMREWQPSLDAIEMVAEEIWETYYQKYDELFEDFQGEHRDRLFRFAKRILEQAKRYEDESETNASNATQTDSNVS